MGELLLKTLNMSIAASWLILAVVLLRFLLKKAPKWIAVLLWGIVAVRLVVPLSFESALSLIPSAETIPEKVMSGPSFDIQTGIAPVDDRINDYLSGRYFEGVTVPVNNGANTMAVLSAIWVIGIVLLIVYTVFSYVQVCRSAAERAPYEENIFLCDHVRSPFILGLIRPKIYLPSSMDAAAMEPVIAHEKAHLARHDQWWKPLGFLILTVHWFNPLCWVAYVLLCRDIELACDEKVIRQMDVDGKKQYSTALLECSTGRRLVTICPLAFGEVGVKERIKSVLHYKKPAFWIIALSAIICILAAVCFLTDPISKNAIVMGANYSVEKVLYGVTFSGEAPVEPPLQYCVTADYLLYVQQTEGEDWKYLGALTPYELTNGELNDYVPYNQRRKTKVRQITDAYILRVEDDNFYLVFQTKSGDTYLSYGWEDIGERGQGVSDDTCLRFLYRLHSNFYSGYVNMNFFERSLRNAAGDPVYCFANFESDSVPGYHIVGFKSGDSNVPAEMTDLGFAVFQTNGEGYRLIDCNVYQDAALVESGIYFCEDPAVADINGEMRDGHTFDVVLILNEDVDKAEWIYHAKGKEDRVQEDTYIDAPYMSLRPWKNSEGYTSVSQYFYDENGNQISAK